MSKTCFLRFLFLIVLSVCFVLTTFLVYQYLKKPISNEQFIINKIDERLLDVDNHKNNESFVNTYSNDFSDVIDLNELVENENNQYDAFNEQNGYHRVQNEENTPNKKNAEVVAPQLSPEEYLSLGELYQHGKFGREKSANMAIFNIKKAIQLSDENDHELLGKCHLTLGQIFESTPNRESAHNMLIHYLQALSYGYEECILLIGKLYANGLHPYYLPDKMVAAKIYSNFSNFSETIKPWCQLNLQDIYKVSYQDLDVLRQNNIMYESLPSDITDQMVNASNKIRFIIPYKSVVDKRLFMKYDDDELPNIKKLKPAKNTPKKVSILTRLPKQVVYNDTQNVHDHSLQNIGNIIIDKLETNKSTDPSSNNFNNNLSELLKDLNQKKYPHVKRVCESLNNLMHSRFEKSEQDVFNLIWDKVKSKNDSKELFLDSLNSGVEHGYVVCSTGKIMRMLSTLDIVDDNVPNLKPEWVIKQEIMQTIGNTINKLTKQEKTQYESEHNDNIKNIVKNRVRNKCVKEYKNVLQESILDIYLKEYFEYI